MPTVEEIKNAVQEAFMMVLQTELPALKNQLMTELAGMVKHERNESLGAQRKLVTTVLGESLGEVVGTINALRSEVSANNGGLGPCSGPGTTNSDMTVGASGKQFYDPDFGLGLEPIQLSQLKVINTATGASAAAVKMAITFLVRDYEDSVPVSAQRARRQP